MLKALEDAGQIKKTNLAGRAGLNYNTCIKYAYLLRLLRWADFVMADDGEYLLLTQLGRQYCKILENEYAQVEPEIKQLEYEIQILDKDDASKTAPPNTNGAKIMLIEDEPDILLTYESILSSQGFSVHAFSNSGEALQRFATAGRSAYRLVISDIRMPGLNGLRLYQAIKALDPSVKFIFVSALDATEELTSVLADLTERQIIKKPVDKAQLLNTVRSLLIGDKSFQPASPYQSNL